VTGKDAFNAAEKNINSLNLGPEKSALESKIYNFVTK
jgi:hypothetical protein